MYDLILGELSLLNMKQKEALSEGYHRLLRSTQRAVAVMSHSRTLTVATKPFCCILCTKVQCLPIHFKYVCICTGFNVINAVFIYY